MACRVRANTLKINCFITQKTMDSADPPQNAAGNETPKPDSTTTKRPAYVVPVHPSLCSVRGMFDTRIAVAEYQRATPSAEVVKHEHGAHGSPVVARLNELEQLNVHDASATAAAALETGKLPAPQS
jgi:hypothetical protein